MGMLSFLPYGFPKEERNLMYFIAHIRYILDFLLYGPYSMLTLWVGLFDALLQTANVVEFCDDFFH